MPSLASSPRASEGVLVTLRTKTRADEMKPKVIEANAEASRGTFQDLFLLGSGRPLSSFKVPHKESASLILYNARDIEFVQNEMKESALIVDIVSLSGADEGLEEEVAEAEM